MRNFLLIITLMLLCLPAAAQDVPPACTADQLTTLQQAVSDFIAGIPDQTQSVADVSQWQHAFWQTADSPDALPDCLEAHAARSLMGHIADTALIVRLAAAANETDLASTYSADLDTALADLQSIYGTPDVVMINTVAPAATPTPTMQIVSFSVTPTTVDRGDTVTITWDIRGVDTVSIYVYYPLQRFPGTDTATSQALTSTGSITYTIPDLPIRSISFSPVFGGPAGQNVTLTVRCPYQWFVSVETSDCPIDDVASLSAAYQPFERGFMVWHSGMIWFFENNGTGGFVPDQWTEGESVVFDQQPPAGLLQPQRGFGKVWVNTASVRDLLGWATAPEQGYTTQYQSTQVSWYGFDYYFTLPDGRTVSLTSGFDSFSWSYMP